MKIPKDSLDKYKKKTRKGSRKRSLSRSRTGKHKAITWLQTT